MPLWLYDIAGSYQAGFSVAIARNEGFVGGVSKITEGLTSNDTWDKRNKDWSKRWHDDSLINGMFWGGYHFLRNGNGAAQARYFLDEMNKITGDGVNGCLVQLDNESDADWQTTKDWSDEFYRLTHDHRYLMYTGNWWWNVVGRRWNGYSLTPHLWDSRYVTGSGYASILYEYVPSTWWNPNYGNWPASTFLQFSSKGSVGGIVGNVDINAFRGSTADLLILTGGLPLSSWSNRALEPAPKNFPYNGEVAAVDTQTVLRTGHRTGWNDNDGEGWWIYEEITAIHEKVDALQIGGVDLDVLSEKVADKILSRLELVQKPV
jgi:hypothetical protein